MCDPELIAAIFKDLGYFNEKKEEDRKEEIDNKSKKDNSKNSGRGEK